MLKAFQIGADFYGTETTIHPDGSKTVKYRGGYQPRPMTANELRPWLVLVKGILDDETKVTCDQPVMAA